MTSSTNGNVEEILAEFGGDPLKAEGLADFLGFDPIPNPEDQLAGPLSGGLKQFIRGRADRGFGVKELYRVGRCKADPAEAGLWIGVLDDWGFRSTDRDRSRRRVTRALVDHVPDRRALALLVPPDTNQRREAELIFPRTQVRQSGGSITSVRAHLDLGNPTRFHRDLLREIRIPPGATLLDVSRLWQKQFSVERVTTEFYQKYAAVRNCIAKKMLGHNQDHPAVKSLSQDEARAWATRQMGRVLFLWFLQAKRWLGEPGGHGSTTYLLDLWKKRGETPEGEYFRGILAPMFFDAMATGSSSHGENPVLGYVPYLNGGLFRRSALEDRINDIGEVTLPDEVFDPEDDNSLLGLLSRYRFTTRESTPDDQSVDPDPELLGRVFENLYQGDERRNTGTYYTPREIVHFMCREALDGYLRDETGVDQDTLDLLRQEAVGSRDEFQTLPNIPDAALIDALETVRICDPAVGSGAFLLGAIQEIVSLRRGILFSKKRYVEPDALYKSVSEWKRRTIENSLYGVDINPEAVEICRLRLWLSMVLDMDEPPEANSNWALPNLDFQMVAGDSLVDRVAGVTFKESWPTPTGLQLGMELQGKLQRLENNIAQRRREFEGTHRNPKRLRELRDLIARDQREIVRLHLEDALKTAKSDLRKLKKGKHPAKTALKKTNSRIERIKSLLTSLESTDFTLVQKPFLWPIAFPEVLREGDVNAGFDIVLANPPYVRQEKLDPEDQLSYAEAFPEVHTGMADILVYFYARALQILRPDGWVSFITSNKYMRARYGASLREHLPVSLRVRRVIDFGDLPLFEANGKTIAAYPAVLLGSRSDHVAGHSLRVADLSVPVRKMLSEDNLKVNTESVRSVLEDLNGLLANVEIDHFPQVLLKKEGWILEDPALAHLFERLMKKGTPLAKSVKGRLYRGIVTGLNDAFVIDRGKRDELVREDPRSAEIIKPWLRGRDIKRWLTEEPEKFVIHVPWSLEISMYPAVLHHLTWFKDRLENRPEVKRGVYPWFAMSRWGADYHDKFAHPKIIFNRFINQPTFAYDVSGAYHNDACYFAVSPTPAIAAIVNSAVGWWLLSHLCTPLQNGYLQVFVQFLEQLPIPDLSRDIDQLLSEHVEALASGINDPDIESEIDSIVFDVYGLSAPERKLVLDWLGERREALGAQLPPDWRKLNALLATAGAWKGKVDADQLIEDVRANRDIHTRPVPRL